MRRGIKRTKYVCANPMSVRVCCTTCHWSKDIGNEEQLKTRIKICATCKKPTMLILD